MSDLVEAAAPPAKRNWGGRQSSSDRMQFVGFYAPPSVAEVFKAAEAERRGNSTSAIMREKL
jgi:hypothetical protein